MCLCAMPAKDTVCSIYGTSFICYGPIAVAARSKAGTVFARSNTEIVGSNTTEGMDVCVRLFCVYPVWKRVRILPP
jgi:hypothetical protein